MKRVYLAGKYSADNIIDCLSNINEGITCGAMLLSKGYAVFCPFLDHHFALTPYSPLLEKKHYQNNSMAWVDVSDALLIMPHSEGSKGVQREIERAKDLGIPVFYSLHDLDEWRDSK